jgi:hypothetical protein
VAIWRADELASWFVTYYLCETPAPDRREDEGKMEEKEPLMGIQKEAGTDEFGTSKARGIVDVKVSAIKTC